MANANTAGYRLEQRKCPNAKCGKSFDCPRTALEGRCCSADCGYVFRSSLAKDARPNVVVDKGKATETDEISGDTRVLTRLVNERIKTLADLVRVAKINTDEWLVERYTVNKWEGFSVPRTTRKDDKDGWTRPDSAPVVTELWQVKAWMRLRVGLISARAEIEALKADAAEWAPRYPPIPFECVNHGNMLEVNIPDLHLGKLAWGNETGWEHYDAKIAERIHDEALEALIKRTSAYKFDEVVYVLGNDLLNSDNQALTTTRGTVQHGDGRHQKTFLIARRMAVRAIERLRFVAPVVNVKMVPGNHDNDTVFYLGDSLQSWFRNCPEVQIDNEPTKRKYHEFGACMLLFTHGNAGKRADFPLLMATEQSAMFGRTKYREAHTGHFHKTLVDEQHGVRVRILPALCAADAWHSEQVFVANVRAAEAYVWSKTEGLITIAVYSDQSERVRCAA